MPDLERVPDGAEMENFHVEQLVLAMTGRLGVDITWKSKDQARVLLQKTDAGIKLTPNATLPAEDRLFHPGMIVAWDRPAAEVPPGWAITATDRFIYGASADGQLGTTGGAATHVHTMAHTHQVTHDHPQENTGDVTLFADARDMDDAGSGINVPHSVTQVHSHTVNLGAITVTSGASSAANTGAADNLPPYVRHYWLRRQT